MPFEGLFAPAAIRVVNTPRCTYSQQRQYDILENSMVIRLDCGLIMHLKPGQDALKNAEIRDKKKVRSQNVKVHAICTCMNVNRGKR